MQAQIILITPNDISLFRLLILRSALKLEVLGMSRRGRSAYTIVKSELGFRGSKAKVLEQLTAHIKTLQESYDATTAKS